MPHPILPAPQPISPLAPSHVPPAPQPIPNPIPNPVPPKPIQPTHVVNNLDNIKGEFKMTAPITGTTGYTPTMEPTILKELHKVEKNIVDVSRQEYYEISDGQKSITAAIAAQSAANALGFDNVALQSQLASQVSASAITLAVNNINSDILADGQKTRDLINSQYSMGLSQQLAEANLRLATRDSDLRYYKDACSNFQSNQVLTAINAINSDLQAVKQGVVNFGTMSGSAGTQSSTNNVVR